MRKIALTILVTFFIVNLGKSQTLNVPDNIGTSNNAGKVGIGTADPVSMLSVGGVGNSRSAIMGTALGTASVFDIGVRGEGTSYCIFGKSLAGAIGVYGASNTGIAGYFTSTSGYGLIVANGNAGIGTTDPQAKLHVNDVTANTELLRLDNGGLRYTSLINYSDGTYDNAGLQFKKWSTVGQFKFSNNNGDLMTILSNGNIGIGITDPIHKLQVYDDRAGYASLVIENSDPSGLGLLVKAGDGSTYVADFRKADNTNLVRIDGSGNVGIGTSTPDNKLSIEGSSSTNIGLSIFNGIYGNSQGNLRFFKTGDSYVVTDQRNAGVIESYNDLILSAAAGSGAIPSIKFQTGRTNTIGNTRMIIDNNGNVGIGTTETGTHKLAVEGTIGAREIKVEAGTWSDFVFNTDYELKDLEEVEAFIEENNHLPGIPSEQEVKENGIQVGEMNAKLLQKIEELTLYMIEQNKETKTMKAQLDKLTQENEKLKNRIEELETTE